MNLLRVAWRDLLALLRDKQALVWMGLMPFAFCALFGMTSQENNNNPQAQIEVLNADGEFLANEFYESLKGKGLKINHYTPENPPHPDSWRILELEAGFTHKILSGEKVRLKISDWGLTNEYDLTARLQVYRSVLKLLGQLLLAEHLQPESIQADDPQKAIGSLERASQLKPILNLDVSEAGFPQIPRGFRHVVPGMMVMFVMFNTLIYGGIIVTLDRTLGRLQRLCTTPIRPWEILGGHFVGSCLIGGVQALVFILAGSFLFKISWGDNPIALAAVLVAFMACCASISMLIGAFAQKEVHVLGVVPIIGTILPAFGGCWWPQEIVPDSLQWLIYTVPTGWALDGILRISTFGRGLVDILPHVGVLLLMGLPFFLIGTWRIRRGMV